MFRAGFVVGLLLLCTAGCGAETNKPDLVPPARTVAEAAALAEYDRLVGLRELETARTSEDQVPAVAANLCENDVADFRLLVSRFEGVSDARGGHPITMAIEKATVIEAFCPDALLLYQQALNEEGYQTVHLAELRS